MSSKGSRILTLLTCIAIAACSADDLEPVRIDSVYCNISPFTHAGQQYGYQGYAEIVGQFDAPDPIDILTTFAGVGISSSAECFVNFAFVGECDDVTGEGEFKVSWYELGEEDMPRPVSVTVTIKNADQSKRLAESTIPVDCGD